MSLIYCSFRKYLYPAYRRDWNFLGGGGSVLSGKKFKEMLRLHWNFQEWHGDGIDIFWDNILCTIQRQLLICNN